VRLNKRAFLCGILASVFFAGLFAISWGRIEIFLRILIYPVLFVLLIFYRSGDSIPPTASWVAGGLFYSLLGYAIGYLGCSILNERKPK